MAQFEIKNLSFTYPGSTQKVLDDLSLSIEAGQYIIHTTQVALVSISLIHAGYRIFIYPSVGKPFEITIGKCVNTSKEIRESHNLEKLLVNGGFDTDLVSICGGPVVFYNAEN